jgi:hypothetical protein
LEDSSHGGWYTQIMEMEINMMYKTMEMEIIVGHTPGYSCKEKRRRTPTRIPL